MTTTKRPSFQFYPGDWQRDMGLHTCSIAARGLLIELLCIMHACEPYGHLSISGGALKDEDAAAAAGVPVRDFKRLVRELEDKDVLSRTDEGVIFSRRMVRDEQTRNARAAGGSAGAEHGEKGASAGVKGGRPPKAKGGLITPLPDENKPPLAVSQSPVLRSNEKPPPSSSSSSSTALTAFSAGSRSKSLHLTSSADPPRGTATNTNGDRQRTNDDHDDLRHTADDARRLTMAANFGIAQKYGEQPTPLIASSGNTHKCVDELRAQGVDFDFAEAVIFAYASTMTKDRPPQSLGYFKQHVLDRWAAECARRDAATYTPGAIAAAPEVDQMRAFAILYAKEGSAEWQAYCDERDIDWSNAA